MTFREKSITRLYAFAMAAVFALVLAGCGGGGGGTTDTGGGTTMPEMCPEGHTGTPPNCVSPEQQEANALAAAKTAAATAASNAASAVAAVMDNSELAPEAYASAQAAVAVANQANSAAQAATTSAAAQAAQAIAESAASDAAMYAGMVTAAKNAADAKAARMAANKVAMSKETAIAAEAGQTTDAGLGGSAASASSGTDGYYDMSISRDRMGTTVEIELEGAADDAPKFMQAMDLGGGRTMHARKMKADDDGNVVEEVVIVSTDIEAPVAVEFAKFKEDLAGTLSQTLNVNTNTENDDPTVTNEALDVSGAISTAASRLSNIMAAGFSSSGGGTLTYPADDSTTDDKDEAFETAGTYNGAMGTYRCNASSGTCSVTYDAKGKISGIGTDWIFTPAEGAMSDQPDYDYLNYGFWLKKTTDKDGVLTYNEVETFAGSTLAVATNTVEGTASYAGGAAGVYVKNVYNSDRTLDTATSGHFTADVNLMAYFGGNDVAVSKQNSIEGTIDNFMLSVEGDDGSAWEVDVAASISTAAVTGTAKGGVTGSDGSFTGTFHGDDSKDVDGTATPIGHKVLVGEFNAVFSDGSVAGGFGARRQDD